MSAINNSDNTSHVIKSFKRWITQIAREFNAKDDEIESIIKDYHNLTRT